jgi:hypothetical protein
MSSLAEIRQAIEKLAPKERAELRQWLDAQDIEESPEFRRTWEVAVVVALRDRLRAGDVAPNDPVSPEASRRLEARPRLVRVMAES